MSEFKDDMSIADLMKMVSDDVLAEDVSNAMIKTLGDLFSYDGFNVNDIARLFFKKGMAFYMGEGQNMDRKAATKAVLSDMRKIIIIVLMRGTSKDLKSKTVGKDSAQTAWNKLFTIYGMKANKKEISDLGLKQSEVTTPGRAVACFPQMTAMAAKRMGDKFQPQGKQGTYLTKYPFLCIPSAPALFPKSSVGEAMLKEWIEYSDDFTERIHNPDSKTPAKKNAKSIGTALYKSTTFSTESRITWMGKLEVNENFTTPATN